MIRSKVMRRCVGWSIVGLIAAVIVLWYLNRLALPFTIHIASALPGGRYHDFAAELATPLAETTGRDVVVDETRGSVDNARRLADGDADLAIVQSGSVAMNELEVIAPLSKDVIIIVVRHDSAIEDIRGLGGAEVALGPPDSGMLVSSMQLLEAYGLAGDEAGFRHLPFTALDEPESTLEAAIVTTGLFNGDLQRMLGTGRYRIIGIDDADAFSLRHPEFERYPVPRGFFSEEHGVPAEDTLTVGTLAMLVAPPHVSDRMVSRTVQALYEHDLQARLPDLFTRSKAAEMSKKKLHLHPVAARYFDPYGGIDTLATFLESIAAGKELLFAIGAGLYLMWRRWRRQRQREHDRVLAAMKEHLDGMLDETARIERAQMETTDPEALKKFLDDVTELKLRALDELTHEDLRGDRMFLIFLLQCGNLISKIQAKITVGLLARR